MTSRRLGDDGQSANPSVVANETRDDWLAFHDATMEALAPEGAVEQAFASRIASLSWRLRRVPDAEADVINRVVEYHLSFFNVTPEEWKELDAMPFYSRPSHEPPPVFPNEKKLSGIHRVEAHLNRQLMHTLHELEALQDRRRGHRPSLARVDVQGLPGT